MASRTCRVIAGVDTHGDTHVAAALDRDTGEHLGTASFAATGAGYVDLLTWLRDRGVVDRVGVESTGSWGAGLTRYLRGESIEVLEVDRPDRKARRFEGKSDPVDAEAAARAVRSGRARVVPKASDGLVEAIRSIEVVHHSASKDRTRAINQFKALLVTAPEHLRQQLRGLSFINQLRRARRFGDGHDDVVERQVRFALKELARRIAFLDEHIARMAARTNDLTTQAAPALVGMHGVGPHVAAQLLATVGDNPERLKSEAAFAKLCGVCPLPASTGKTNRHRLNRGGDRRANNALYTIVLVRMRYHAPTRGYVARRTREGKSTREIIRCLKRFVAREVYQAVTNPPENLPTASGLRALRRQRGISINAVANALDTSIVKLSKLERGLVHDTNLAGRCQEWLEEQP
jgi:transposase